VPRLIAAKVSRVVVGCLDPNPRVAGKGIAQLKAEGINTTVGVLEQRAKQLNAAYFARVLKGRPYVTLKWAQSADGRVAAPDGGRRTISNAASLRVVHELRSRCDAIVVGIHTVQCDDPLLTARGVPAVRPLLRVVIDPRLRLPPESQLAKTAHVSPVIVYCTSRTIETCPLAAVALRARRIEVVPLAGDERHFQLIDLLHDLYRRRVTHVLVEPGPNLAAEFFRENLADRVWRFCSPDSIGQESAPKAAKIPMEAVARMDLRGDTLTEHLNPNSPVYFAQEPSADWRLVGGSPLNAPRERVR
jgi:diaminohydroxyphosphoribosylaminopyrimidine deaminase/5-amino-6-(5-phosphoribosylamino)uracil reductase